MSENQDLFVLFATVLVCVGGGFLLLGPLLMGSHLIYVWIAVVNLGLGFSILIIKAYGLTAFLGILAFFALGAAISTIASWCG